ncbi:MAG: DUF2330 domain-containing protein [Myxococcales bacterium]|nr:DUF2330 domain-containing protein [Myxococcales bacterium]
MRRILAASFVLVSALAPFLWTEEASACGGCFVSQSESTQVTGHRMALSVSATQTTLWDQITYDGDPTEFAWVLPIKGQVEIGLSSDLLFQVLEAETQVVVSSPTINCPPPNCPGDAAGFGATGATSGSGGGVTVIAQEVVGPYETVQLQASDPLALNTWLESHGYNIPADVEPVVSQYVTEGFGFLALRLVPGQGIDSMKPVRITSPGASPTLPLRMVAAGTGARTPITLWVLAEGRYEPQNFGFETISASELIWDWGTASSNYAQRKQEIFDADGGSRWLMEAGEQKGMWLFDSILSTAEYDPAGSGYADESGQGAVEAAAADVATLTAGINPSSLWVTRISADLSREALGVDLRLQASTTQQPIERYLQVQNTVGIPPACPTFPPCDNDGSTFPGFGDINNWDPFGEDANDGSSGGCGFARTPARPSELALIGLAGAAAVLARRRRAKR